MYSIDFAVVEVLYCHFFILKSHISLSGLIVLVAIINGDNNSCKIQVAISLNLEIHGAVLTLFKKCVGGE